MQLIVKYLSRILITFASALLVSSSAFALEDIGARPANPVKDNPRTQSIFIYEIDKGGSKSDAVQVVNNSDHEQVVELYAADAIISNDGSMSCRQKVEAREAVGAWTKVKRDVVRVAAHASTKVPFTITMPSNVGVGEHNGCLVIQQKEDEDASIITQGNVRIRTRSAIRIAITVPGELQKRVDIASFDTSFGPSGQRFNIGIKNSGNVSSDTNVYVTLTSLFGREEYKNGGNYAIIAGALMEQTFVNEKPPFWGGWYYAQGYISYDERAGSFGVKQNDNFVTKYADKQLVFIMPNIGALLLMIMVALLVTAAIVYDIYLRDERAIALRYAHKYTVKPGDTLRSLAKEHGVSWKDIASLNKLKPPFDIEPGMHLAIPPKKARKSRKRKKA